MSRYFYAQYKPHCEGHGLAGGWGTRSGTPPDAPPSTPGTQSGSRAPCQAADPHGPAEAYAVLWLRPGAPPEVVRAAYRALAAHLHPDVGGDAAAMRRLNAAYALLLSGRG